MSIYSLWRDSRVPLPPCYYCKRRLSIDYKGSEIYPTRDHVIPRSKGGTNGRSNVVWACRRCNRDKGDMMPEDFVPRTMRHQEPQAMTEPARNPEEKL